MTLPVPASEPPDWRDIPDVYEGKIEPNFYCRAWNPGRGKYCKSIAGRGTDHPGKGRCKNHGGATPVRSGLYSVIRRPRIAELIAHFETAEDPLSTFPELFAGRALFTDWVERYDEITGALLAWHASFSPSMRPLPQSMVHALEVVLDELESYVGPVPEEPEVRLEPEAEPHGGWLTRARREDAPDDSVAQAIRDARKLLVALQVPPDLKPRQMPDLADGHRILNTIAQIVERIEKVRAQNAISRKDFLRVMMEMGRAVEARVQDAAVLEKIRDDWSHIRLA